MSQPMDSEERLALEQLAQELREAHPHPALSTGFLEELSLRVQSKWSFRSAMKRNPVIRVAAGLLMISLVAAPVSAFVILLHKPKSAPQPLGFAPVEELPQEMLSTSAQPSAPTQVIGPEDEFDLPGSWSQARLNALERANRLAQAGASWRQQPSGVATHIEDGLWKRFLEACAQGDNQVDVAWLESTLNELRALAQPSPAQQTALVAWNWVASGQQGTAALAPLAWDGAPFVVESR